MLELRGCKQGTKLLLEGGINLQVFSLTVTFIACARSWFAAALEAIRSPSVSRSVTCTPGEGSVQAHALKNRLALPVNAALTRYAHYHSARCRAICIMHYA